MSRFTFMYQLDTSKFHPFNSSYSKWLSREYQIPTHGQS